MLCLMVARMMATGETVNITKIETAEENMMAVIAVAVVNMESVATVTDIVEQIRIAGTLGAD